MAKEQEAKTKKKRTKRETMVLENIKVGGDGDVGTYHVLQCGFPSSTEAMKWIKENGTDLTGKIICIASMTPPRKVEVETKSVVKF